MSARDETVSAPDEAVSARDEAVRPEAEAAAPGGAAPPEGPLWGPRVAALATAAIGSFVAGTISTVGITFAGPAMAQIAEKIQPAEYFAVMILAFATVTAVVADAPARGLCSLFLGLAIGLVGIDSLTGQARYTFGVPELYDGIQIVAVAVGLFAIGETLYTAARLRRAPEERVLPVGGGIAMSPEDWRRSWKPWLRGTATGLPIGALPAGGAEIPTFLSYNVEKRLSRHKKQFGKGAIEGVAGPEAANNAAFSGVLMPLLTLGIPTSATAGATGRSSSPARSPPGSCACR
ncbi:tripartite tricarboxylate transporter permease [Streptomyces niphimycinicus]|uniref:tripartite tricarboxylate transporter permease n=1 Tax=Streptomyces niphimycinicus TaxID=2842201 RepID=UPI00209AFB7F|nr:tripartite tricarboxylate transporter permease [Streptomyces niphimycinicus]